MVNGLAPIPMEMNIDKERIVDIIHKELDDSDMSRLRDFFDVEFKNSRVYIRSGGIGFVCQEYE